MDSITFTKSEQDKIDEFYKEHKNCCSEYLNKPFFSTTGGQYTFITPTGLGNISKIRCNACGVEKDITDDNCRRIFW